MLQLRQRPRQLPGSVVARLTLRKRPRLPPLLRTAKLQTLVMLKETKNPLPRSAALQLRRLLLSKSKTMLRPETKPKQLQPKKLQPKLLKLLQKPRQPKVRKPVLEKPSRLPQARRKLLHHLLRLKKLLPWKMPRSRKTRKQLPLRRPMTSFLARRLSLQIFLLLSLSKCFPRVYFRSGVYTNRSPLGLLPSTRLAVLMLTEKTPRLRMRLMLRMLRTSPSRLRLSLLKPMRSSSLLAMHDFNTSSVPTRLQLLFLSMSASRTSRYPSGIGTVSDKILLR